jgi:hypothetical protein
LFARSYFYRNLRPKLAERETAETKTAVQKPMAALPAAMTPVVEPYSVAELVRMSQM